MESHCKTTVLIIDNEGDQLRLLKRILATGDYDLELARSPGDAIVRDLCAQRREDIQVVVLDLLLPDEGTGLALLEEIAGLKPSPPIIIVTVDDRQYHFTVQTRHLGAAKLLYKGDHRFRNKLRKAVAQFSSQRTYQAHATGWTRPSSAYADRYEVVGNSQAMRDLGEQVATALESRDEVLICGERGTGKELIARSLHRSSDRADKPFVAFSCDIPKELAEAVLFGSEAGKIPGVHGKESHKGRFREADGGVLFIDEVANVQLEIQAKLLRCLQEREVLTIGESEPVSVDVKVVTASNKDLNELVKSGAFLADLRDRLWKHRIVLPPLRDRTEDLPALVDRTIQLFNAERPNRPQIAGIEMAALPAMADYDWPGNVRELENVITVAAAKAALTQCRIVTAESVCACIEERRTAAGRGDEPVSQLAPLWRAYVKSKRTDDTLRDAVKSEAERLLKETSNTVESVAHISGLSKPTVYKILYEVGLREKQ